MAGRGRCIKRLVTKTLTGRKTEQRFPPRFLSGTMGETLEVAQCFGGRIEKGTGSFQHIPVGNNAAEFAAVSQHLKCSLEHLR